MSLTQITFNIKGMAASQPLVITITDGTSHWTLGSGLNLSSPTDSLSITAVEITPSSIQINGGDQNCDITLLVDVETTGHQVSGNSTIPMGTVVHFSTANSPAQQLPNGPFIMGGMNAAAAGHGKR